MQGIFRKQLLIVIAVCALLVASYGCGSGEVVDPEDPGQPEDPTPAENQDGGPRQGGTVSIAIDSDPENMNPLILPTGVVRPIFETMFNALVRSDANMEWEPDLATSWTVSGDTRTVTFNLRDDVKWHDGEPLTARDVAFTLSSMAHPAYIGGQFGHVQNILGAQQYRDGEADDVEGIEVIDDHTIAITTVEPDASIFVSVSLGAIGVIPEHILGDVPHDEWQVHPYNREPVGTGPFKFARREADSHITLEAFDDYFAGRPHVDRVVWRIGDSRAQMAAFMNEEVDVISVPTDEVDMVQARPFANVIVHDRLSFSYIGMNNLHPVFAETAVRQAVATALNVQEITRAVTHGYGVPITVPTYHGSWAYPADFEGWPHDPELAAQMLDEAGWVLNSETGVREKDGVTTEVRWNHASGDVADRTAAMVQQDLEAVGFRLDIQAVDFATMTHLLMPRDSKGVGRAHTPDDFHIYTLGLTVRADPQPIERQFHSANVSPQGHNYVSYSNPRVDELFAEARRSLDFETRRAVFQDLFTILGTDVPWIPLYSAVQASGAHQRVQNFDPNALGQVHNITEWWLKDD